MTRTKITPTVYQGMRVTATQDYAATMGRTVPAGTVGTVHSSFKGFNGAWRHVVHFDGQVMPVAIPAELVEPADYPTQIK